VFDTTIIQHEQSVTSPYTVACVCSGLTCQVRLVLGRDNVDEGEPSEEPQVTKLSHPDAALSSLLQILMDRLDADVAMGSLLDEET
jgi:hypothetical protein